MVAAGRMNLSGVCRPLGPNAVKRKMCLCIRDRENNRLCIYDYIQQDLPTPWTRPCLYLQRRNVDKVVFRRLER